MAKQNTWQVCKSLQQVSTAVKYPLKLLLKPKGNKAE